MAIYPNDHRPAHVPVIGEGHEAVFLLGCPAGPPALRENYGFSRVQLSKIAGIVDAHLEELFRHGSDCMELDEKAIDQANARAKEMQAMHPKAIAARYDRRLARIIIQLNTRLEIAFAPQDAQGLEDAGPGDLEPIEISPSGFGIYFPKLDADLYLPTLLEGFLGSKKWMAARMGAEGGRVRSKAKTAAARANGALGGRPKKKKTASQTKAASKLATARP